MSLFQQKQYNKCVIDMRTPFCETEWTESQFRLIMKFFIASPNNYLLKIFQLKLKDIFDSKEFREFFLKLKLRQVEQQDIKQREINENLKFYEKKETMILKHFSETIKKTPFYKYVRGSHRLSKDHRRIIVQFRNSKGYYLYKKSLYQIFYLNRSRIHPKTGYFQNRYFYGSKKQERELFKKDDKKIYRDRNKQFCDDFSLCGQCGKCRF